MKIKKISISLKSIEPVLEKLEQLSKVQRILMCIGIFIGLVGFFVYFSYYPKIRKISLFKKELVELEKKLAAAKKNASELKKWRTNMKLAEVKFKKVMKALPEKNEIPSLVAGISQSGRDAGLEFVLFQPKKEIKKNFYVEIPVAIKVTGNYHNTAVFFDKVGRLPRIVNINDIKMIASKSGGALSTSCMAVTYKFADKPAAAKK